MESAHIQFLSADAPPRVRVPVSRADRHRRLLAALNAATTAEEVEAIHTELADAELDALLADSAVLDKLFAEMRADVTLDQLLADLRADDHKLDRLLTEIQAGEARMLAELEASA